MKLTDFIQILNHPDNITSAQTQELENVLQAFPYLQSARATYLKGLFNQKSFKYNTDLKITAAYTTDRSILFEFITSNSFKSITNSSSTNIFEINNMVINQMEVVSKKDADLYKADVKLENAIINSVSDSQSFKIPQNNFENEFEAVYNNEIKVQDKNTEIETRETNLSEDIKQKPIEFNPNESYSFSQWLQLANMRPIDRSNEMLEEKSILKEVVSDTERENKFKLIDEFIEKNPKIVPVKNAQITPINIEKSTEEKSYLMTETLARVYLDQKKYTKAIQAYEILILKYPEKSSLFAERIVEIKNIQNNN